MRPSVDRPAEDGEVAVRMPSRYVSLRSAAAGFAALATVAAFVQIERGIGSTAQSLLYVGHDLMMCLALAIGFVLLTRRPWASAFAGVVVVLLVWFASYLKTQATAVPALASDLLRLVDAWQIVAGFGWPAILALVGCVGLFLVMFRLEDPVPIRWRQRLASVGAAGALMAGSGAIQAEIPAEDFTDPEFRVPKIAQFVRSIYAKPEFRDASFPGLGPYCCFRDASRPTLKSTAPVMPNLVVVLQESTFPPENIKGVAPVRNALLEGSSPLRVDVVGGGTWVEEYSMLHGVPPSVYGSDFLQVLWLGRKLGLEGRLAPMLSASGYRTVSILPYFGHEVADSDEMQRSLGFERVVDCSDIEGCERGGVWTTVTDAGVYDRALKELRSSDRPALVYAATMRQHSPHVYRYPKHAFRDEILAEYRRRLELSGAEIEGFLRELQSLERPTIVLVFGDHVPSDVQMGFTESDFRTSPRRTFFNLYDAEGRGVAGKVMGAYPSVEAPSTAFLDAILLRFAGFESDYIDRKLAMMRDCGGVFCGKPGGGSEVVARGARH